MKETIIRLWRGNLSPAEKFAKDTEYRKHLHQLLQEESKLTPLLDSVCAQLWEHCATHRAAMNSRGEELIFTEGFRLAVRLLLEALSED